MNGFEITGRLLIATLVIGFWLFVAVATGNSVHEWTGGISTLAFMTGIMVFSVGVSLSVPSVLPGGEG